MKKPESVTLEGRYVRLVPLTPELVEALVPVAVEPELWRWTLNIVRNAEDLRTYFATAFAEREQGKAVPFVVIDRATDTPIGSTRYANIDVVQGRLEIGWTWYGTKWQRTGVNTETKILLLSHAFETLGAQRVELKTDALNTKSRSAMERMGATFEGIHRKWGVAWDGHIRDTAWYSVIDDEWPDVKARLVEKLR